MNRFFAWFGLPGEMVLAGILLVLALLTAVVFRNRERVLAAVGMAFCALGNAAVVNFMDFGRFLAVPPLLAGMVFFILGRVGLSAAYGSLMKRNRYPLETRAFGTGVVLTLAFLAAFLVAMITGDTFPGAAQTAVSLLLLLSSGGLLSIVWSYAKTERTIRSAAAAGALALFGVDAVYAAGVLCRVPFPETPVWWVYPFAQLLLLLCV